MRNGKTAVAAFRRSRVPTMEKLICFIWEWNISNENIWRSQDRSQLYLKLTEFDSLVVNKSSANG